MSFKVLVADDSQTIQKIVKITLEHESYHLSYASSENELFDLLSKGHFDLLLLDFGLAESGDGYQLYKKIRQAQSDIPLLMMFGTFDTVEESDLEKNHVRYKLIKPFDSKELIKICQEILSKAQSKVEQADIQKDKDAEESFDQWEVSHHEPALAESVIDKKSNEMAQEDLGPLTLEMKKWGIDLPPQLRAEILDEKESTVYPADADLEYPDLEFSSAKDKLNEVKQEVKNENTNATFIERRKGPESSISLNSDLITEDDLQLELDGDDRFETTETFSYSADDLNKTDSEKHLLELQEKIQDEVGEDSLWTVDAPESKTITSETTKIREEKKENIELSADLDYANFAKEVEKILPNILPNIFQEYLKKNGPAIIEKVAWDVIPELAENLIKKELQKMVEETKKEKNGR